MRAAIRARDVPISFEELHEKWLDHEAYLKREEAKKGSLTITAHFNQKGSYKKGMVFLTTRFKAQIVPTKDIKATHLISSKKVQWLEILIPSILNPPIGDHFTGTFNMGMDHQELFSSFVTRWVTVQRCAALDLLHIHFSI